MKVFLYHYINKNPFVSNILQIYDGIDLFLVCMYMLFKFITFMCVTRTSQHF